MAKRTKENQYYISRINTRVLNYAVYVMNPGERLMYIMALMAAGGAVGLIFYGGLFKRDGAATLMTAISNVVVFLAFGLLSNKFFMKSVRESLRKKRMSKLRTQFSDFASAMTNALASGMNINDSIKSVYADLRNQYTDEAYIVQEVREILNGINNNIAVEDMLEDFGRRSGDPDILNFATVFGVCFRTGGDVKSVVRRTTEVISEKIMIESEIDTALTSNKLQANVMNIMPIALVFMMRILSSQFSESFGSIIGVIGLTISGALTVAAFVLGRKIMDIK